MSTTLRQLALLVLKDVRIEARARQTLGLVTVLGALIKIVLGLGLAPEHRTGGVDATAILWPIFYSC